MIRVLRYLPAALAAVALAACGGGHGSTSGPLATSTGLNAATPFSVTVPIAAGIQSIGITSPLESGSPEHAIATSGAAASCTVQTATKVCTAALTLPSGAQTLGIAIHAAATTHTALHVTLGSDRIALAVGATVAQVSLDPPSTQLAGGTSSTTTIYVTARDASGNAIVGDYGTTIALASSDASVTLSPASVTTSGTTVTATYSGSASVAPSVSLSATVSGLAASAIVGATLGFTTTQVIFIGGGAADDQILEFPATASGNTAPMRRVNVTGTSGLYSINPDGKGNLALCAFHAPLVPVSFGSSASFYGADLATIPVPTSDGTAAAHFLGVLPAQTLAADCATDGAGTTFALYTGASSGILAITSGTSTVARTITGSATGLGVAYPPDAIAIGPDGSIAVSQTNSALMEQILIFAPGANGNVAPARIIAGSSTMLSSGSDGGVAPLAWGPDGSLYALTVSPGSGQNIIGNQTVVVFAPGATGNVAPARVIAGAATELSQQTGTVYSLAPSGGRVGAGLAVDNAGRVYVASALSTAGVEILRFDAGATGDVAPTNVLGGALTMLTQSAGMRISGGTVAPLPASGPPSVSGDFLAYAANRGWNYTATPAAPFGGTALPAFTVTLYANPNPVNSSVQYALLQTTGVVADATAGTLAADVTFNNASGYIATAASSVSNGVHYSVPLPSGLTLLPASLTLGQTFTPYPGVTATVTNVGTVPGASACPPTSVTTGASVSYVVGNSVELVSYVPGCGITDLITDNGTEFQLTSIGSYPQLGTQAVGRTSFAEIARRALRSVWKSVFTPWRAGR